MKGIPIAGLLVIAAIVLHGNSVPLSLPDLGGLFKPAVVEAKIPAPSPDLQAAVAPIGTILKGHQADAAELRSLALALADVVGRDTTAITTTGQARELIGRSGKLLGANLTAKHPGLADAINKAFEASLGLEQQQLDTAKRTRFVETCRAVAWAAENAN